jgi:hypothetical protein
MADIQTYGDLKGIIRAIITKQTAGKILNLSQNVIGMIPGVNSVVTGLLSAKSTFDAIKAFKNKPDNKKTNTWLDKLDIDDDMSKMLDDTVEDGFIQMITKSIESEPNDKPLESDFNMNQKMVDYLKNNYSGRTVSGIQENTMNIRELIRQAIEQVLDEENATSGGEAYMTKFAFSKGGDNRATKYAEKLGYKKVGKVPKKGKTFEFVKWESLVKELVNEKLYILTPNAFGTINPKAVTLDGSREVTEDSIKKSEHQEEQEVVNDMLSEVSYRSFTKTVSEVSPERKISKAILGIKKRLREVNQIVDYSIRLRNENSLTTENYLTNSVRGLEEISTRLTELDKKIKNLKE